MATQIAGVEPARPIPEAARPRALVTGASSGIGEAFARALAARGQDLVLVARSAARLESLAAELGAAHGVHADVIVADLAEPSAADAIAAELAEREIEIGMLVNNAGFGSHGEFATLDGSRERDEIIVNAFAPVALTQALLPSMLARRHGAIINVASTAAFQPVPYMATYGATKAFVLSFSEALAEEVRSQGVLVVALCPGQTDTAFFETIEDARIGRMRTTTQVVNTGLRALDRGQSVVIDGFGAAALANLSRFSPRWMVARITAAMFRPRETGGPRVLSP